MQHVLCIGPGKDIINEGKYILKHVKQDDPQVFIHFVDHSVVELSTYDEFEINEQIFSEAGDKQVQIDVSGQNIFSFLENYKLRNINYIVANRVFEHIPREKMFYLLYLLKDVSIKGAVLSIVVPNFIEIFEKLSTLNKTLLRTYPESEPGAIQDSFESCAGTFLEKVSNFEKALIDIHTEIFNEPSDPHRCVWTPGLAKYYLELEQYWEVSNIDEIILDNRDWYLKILATSRG